MSSSAFKRVEIHSNRIKAIRHVIDDLENSSDDSDEN